MKDRIHMYEPLWGAWYVDELIGEGNFGKVYRVKRTEFGENYYAAVKIITIPQHNSEVKQAYAEGMDDASIRSYFEGFTSDLLKEIRLMSSLKGTTNIVSIEDHTVIEKKDGIGWDVLIRMELLTNFNDYLAASPISRGDVIKLGIDICNALDFCRKSNIVHRDIKPDNIFVSPHGDFKLGDFGIARQIEKTASGLSKKGTFSHMAPEVYKGDKYNATVDIYSLGIVLYRLLNNNRTPFLPDYPAAITYQDREEALVMRMGGEPFPPPTQADEQLASIILKACAYNPKDRFLTPGEMLTALEKALSSGDNSAVVWTPVTDKSAAEGLSSGNTADSYYAKGEEKTTGLTNQLGFGDEGSPQKAATVSAASKLETAASPEQSPESISETGIVPAVPAVPVASSKSREARRSKLKPGLVVAAALLLLLLGAGAFALTGISGGEAFAISDSELVLNPDASQQLALSGFDRGDPTTLTWESDNPDVAVVCAEGIVTAVGAGTATVTVTTTDGKVSTSVIEVVIPVVGATLDHSRVSLLSDGEIQLQVSITPEEASNQNVTWSSSNETVAIVDQSGLVKAMGKGEAVISVTTEDGEITAVCIVTVGDISLSLVQGSMTINVGSSVTLEVEVNPPEASEHKLLWSSSDSSVADVNQEGKVNPKAPGEAVITVATEDGEVSASTTVTVLQPVTGVTLNRSSHTLNVGDTFDLSATVEPGNASNKGISWSSSNSSVATVSSTGRVTAVSRGTATITVTTADGNKTATCSVTVAQPVTGVSLNKSSLSLNTGQSETLSATVSPADANNKDVTWSSSNTSVATVNSSGRVSAVGRGTATITVTTADGNKTATCSVTVRQLPTGVSLNKSSFTLYVGDSETLSATVSPSDANNKDVTWSSSNTSVATVNSSGRVTAVGAGTATITVRTVEGNRTATATVTVKPLTRAIYLGPGSYGNFGNDLNNYYTSGNTITTYRFEFVTGSRIPANGHLFSYYGPSNWGMGIYFNSSRQLVVYTRWEDHVRIDTATTQFSPNTPYVVIVKVWGASPYREVVINGQTQNLSTSGPNYAVRTSMSTTKYLGDNPATNHSRTVVAPEVYITRLQLSGTRWGSHGTLRTFTWDISNAQLGATSFSDGGINLNLTGTSVQNHKLP